jgi:hypothetical protein
MNNFVELITNIAWPTTVLVIFFTLKKNLSALLDRTRRVKYGDTQVDFSERLREIANSSAEETLSDNNNNESIPPLDDLVVKLIEVDPYSAILVSWVRFAEVGREVLGDIDSMKNAVILIRQLQEGDFINQKDADLLDMLRQIRNDAAHHRSVDVDQDSAYKVCKVLQVLASELTEKMANKAQ